MHKINYSLYKTIGFLNYDENFLKKLNQNKFIKKSYSNETNNFLDQTYYSEYLNIMFKQHEQGSFKFNKEFDIEIKIKRINEKVKVNYIDLFIFNDPFSRENIGIFSIDYKIENNNLNKFSDISNSLNRYETEIIFQEKEFYLKEFISSVLLFGHDFYSENSALNQYSGSKFKNYIVIDLERKDLNIDNLLFEIGTCSKINTINDSAEYAPSENYKNLILENKISCFKNYDCLALLDSFTCIGENNYNEDNIYAYSTWSDIYHSIYIYNLYVKCCLQIISNDFGEDAMSKRDEFQQFYNKYYLNKISFNFLPNELFFGIKKGLEIKDDTEFINDRLETLATQVNEKQQKQQEFLLLCISIIALLETPLHLEGIREIIGINNHIIFNSVAYALLLITVISFLIMRIRRK